MIGKNGIQQQNVMLKSDMASRYSDSIIIWLSNKFKSLKWENIFQHSNLVEITFRVQHSGDVKVFFSNVECQIQIFERVVLNKNRNLDIEKSQKWCLSVPWIILSSLGGQVCGGGWGRRKPDLKETGFHKGKYYFDI